MIHQEQLYLTYPNAKIVGECVKTMLHGKEPFPACPTIFIGYNGKEFVSSSDWEVETPEGKCIFPFGILPQYPSFIQVYAGMEYLTYSFWDSPIIYLDHEAKHCETIIIMPDGKQIYFPNGEPLKVAATNEIAQKFPLTDCRVTLKKTKNSIIYSIIPDNNTVYGSFNGENI